MDHDELLPQNTYTELCSGEDRLWELTSTTCMFRLTISCMRGVLPHGLGPAGPPGAQVLWWQLVDGAVMNLCSSEAQRELL